MAQNMVVNRVIESSQIEVCNVRKSLRMQIPYDLAHLLIAVLPSHVKERRGFPGIEVSKDALSVPLSNPGLQHIGDNVHTGLINQLILNRQQSQRSQGT